MSNWRITKIDNSKHYVECKHPNGEKLKFTVPLEHIESELKMLYIKAQCEVRDAELALKAEATKVEAEVKAKLSFFKSARFYQILSAVEAVAILALYFLR